MANKNSNKGTTLAIEIHAELSFDDIKSKFVIELVSDTGRHKVYSRPKKDAILKTWDRDFLDSRFAKKFGFTFNPDLVDLTTGQDIPKEALGSKKAQATVTKQSKYDINRRFQFVEVMTNMVFSGDAKSAIITGEGGLGKSHTVMAQLWAAGKQEGRDYVVIKGYITPKALYRLIHDNADRTIIMDDCDSSFKDPVCANMMKAILEDKPIRTVSWLTDKEDADLESTVTFRGQVIFISNIPEEKFPQALKSRAMMVDLSMSMQDKIDRMKAILFDISPEIEGRRPRDLAMAFLEANADRMRDFNLRTLEKVIKLAHGAGEDWEAMAEFMTCEA